MAKQTTKEVLKLAADKVALREKCRTDKMFLAQELGYDFQPDVHAELFANFLQIDPSKTLDAQSECKDRMVLWSRGHYKTTAIVVEMVQLILNFPNIRILLMQGTVKNTLGLLKELKSHFDGTNFRSNLKDIFPDFCQTDKRLGTAHTFTVPARDRTHLKEGTVTVASPKSVKAGQHYEAGFFDDLINEQNFRNPEMVRKAIDDFNQYVPLIDPGYYRYVTGTRYTFGDLYEWVMRNGQGWKVSVKACWTVDGSGVKTAVFPQRVLPDGRTVGFTVEMLEKKQLEDPTMFAAQYLNEPISSTEQLFTEELLMRHIRTTAEKDFPSLGFKVLVIDLATSGQGDDSVVLCGQQDVQNNLYITFGVGGQWKTDQFALIVIEQALLHRPVKILLEKSAAGEVFKFYLEQICRDKNIRLPLEFIKVSNQKDAKNIRISTLSGAFRQKKLYFLAGLQCWKNLSEQFTGFPRLKHDDYPDTVALMYQYFAVNGVVTPVVKSLAHYLMQQPAVPAFTQEADHESNLGGGLGSDF